MIAGYELTANTIAAVNANAYSEFQSGGTRRCYIRELGLASQAATAAPKTALGRPGNTPTAGSLTVGGAQDSANAAATGGITTTWTTAPTVPSPVMRQIDFPATIGSAVIWIWPPDGELVVGITRNLSIVVFNAGGTTGPILSQYVVWSE